MKLINVNPNDIAKCCPLDGVRVAELRGGDYGPTSVTLVDVAGHIMVLEGSQYSGCLRFLVAEVPAEE